ncbi:MAG: ParB/RepB/Spo0J family partition protein [Pseudomonadota bacterium]
MNATHAHIQANAMTVGELNEAQSEALANANAELSNAGLPIVHLTRELDKSDGFKLIPLDLIDAAPQQRQSSGLDESLDELAASIKRHGLLQPILVRPNEGGRYTIVAGHRRTFAAQLAGLDAIPAKVQAFATITAADEAQLVENIQRENLNLDEIAAALASLFDVHKNLGALMKITGKSKSWVSKHMAPAMPNFGKLARELLQEDRTSDIELLMIISSIEKHDATKLELKSIREGVAAGTFGRKEARRMLAKLKKEGDTQQQDVSGEGEGGQDGSNAELAAKKLAAFVIAWPDDHGGIAFHACATKQLAEDFAAKLDKPYSLTEVKATNPLAI